MPHDTSLASAVRSETAAPYAAQRTASPPPETLLVRIERAGPAALDDHELLGLIGIHIDIATLAAAGGLRELLDDPDDTLGTRSWHWKGRSPSLPSETRTSSPHPSPIPHFEPRFL